MCIRDRLTTSRVTAQCTTKWATGARKNLDMLHFKLKPGKSKVTWKCLHYLAAKYNYPRPHELRTELLYCFGGNFQGSVHFLLRGKILRPKGHCGACMFYKKWILRNVHKIYVCSTLKVCPCWTNAPGYESRTCLFSLVASFHGLTKRLTGVVTGIQANVLANYLQHECNRNVKWDVSVYQLSVSQ